MEILTDILRESWHLLTEASIYMLFGIIVGGLLKVFLSPAYVARHLGRGRFASVFKAALLGIPLPLCSCGVLPAAASLKKQGANNGATTAFLISTPESGVDSIAITYALLDPIMTVARPVSAFLTAFAAGLTENIINKPRPTLPHMVDNKCIVDNCCDGKDCSPEEHARHHSGLEKIRAGLSFAFNDLWADLANWFLVGLLLGGTITALIPEDFMIRYLGGGLHSMLMMLLVGIPLYICATASTPIAAALILKGVSPGTALVFLLVGPATNMASISVLTGLLGKRATLVYLTIISAFAVICGILLDQTYDFFGISPQAVVGQATELFPAAAKLTGAVILMALSIKPLGQGINRWRNKFSPSSKDGCGCSSSQCEPFPQTMKPESPPTDSDKTCGRF